MSAPVQNNELADQHNYKEGHVGHTNGHHAPVNAGPGGVVPKPHQSQVSQVYDPQFFKIANPGPLGLISFALTTFVLGLYQCGAG